MYLPILHLLRVELRCKLQKKNCTVCQGLFKAYYFNFNIIFTDFNLQILIFLTFNTIFTDFNLQSLILQLLILFFTVLTYKT